jgi:hypothetical protein
MRAAAAAEPPPARNVRLAIVGDVHDQWSEVRRGATHRHSARPLPALRPSALTGCAPRPRARPPPCAAQADAHALQFLRPDATLFVGDFGNEAVPLVER